MKSRFFVIVTIIALVGFVVTLDYGNVWAQQEAPTAEQVWEAKYPINLEFSDSLDKEAEEGVPGWGISVLDPRQVIYTHPKDAVGAPFPRNTFDFCYEGEVDALANGGDAFFHDLIVNNAVLLVSFEGDPFWGGPIGPGDDPPDGPIAVYAECNGGTHFPKWDHEHCVNDPNTVDDLDGMEVWGPYYNEEVMPDPDDADYYSLLGDPIPDGGVPTDPKYSVFCIVLPDTHDQIPYVPHSDIVAAVTNPVLTIPEEGAQHYEGDTLLIDLDALMVFEEGGINGDHVWNAGDTIIFSIRNTIPFQGNWDGGEIVVLPFGGPPSYLNHGLHLWHTAFGVATAFDLDPPTEEVDAIEAYPQQPRPQTPALTEWGLIILVALLIASTIFVMLRRRKAAVPA